MPITKDQIHQVLQKQKAGWEKDHKTELEATRWWLAVYEAEGEDLKIRVLAEMMLDGIKPLPRTWSKLLVHLNQNLFPDDEGVAYALKILDEFYTPITDYVKLNYEEK